jgi:hypothetical protein
MTEQPHDDGECRRSDERRADSLQGPSPDQDSLALGKSGEERRSGQNREAEHEHTAGAEYVAELAALQQQAANGDDVGVENPGKAFGGEAEVGLHGGQGHADDGRVEDDDELRRAEKRQRPSSEVVGHGRVHDVCSFERAGPAGRFFYRFPRGHPHGSADPTVSQAWKVKRLVEGIF